MNRKNLLALIIYALDRDILSWPVTRVIEDFKKDAVGIKSNYTDPTDELLYTPNIVDADPIEILTDYILMYAKMYVESGTIDYGKYNNQIINYQSL